MPILSTKAESVAVSDALSTDLMRKRGAGAESIPTSSNQANFVGRNRANEAKAIISPVSGQSFPIRIRGCVGESFPISNVATISTASIPPRSVPIGKLTYRESPLNLATFLWGNRHDILFSVTGGKLAGLFMGLKIYRLNGDLVIEKRVSFSPGGVAPNPDVIIQSDGEQATSGWILLMPFDWLKISSASPIRPIELKYNAEISNNQSRRYLIEEGRFFLK